MEEDKKWDEYLKRQMKNASYGTNVQWEHIEDRVREPRVLRNQLRRVLQFAALFVGLFMAAWVYKLNSSPSWESVQSESIDELSADGGRFFSAAELHGIYGELD
ncbi:MAG: hypothetical protein GVX78_03725 [Bacteroidetes bacterium]|jgi:hypothetical protein|nr:hypothetical protein [Bacteroidota bacterium]